MKPFVMLLTGISGSGKTTLANKLSEMLKDQGMRIQVIDGDETRKLTGQLYGHSREDRISMSRINQSIGYYLVKNNVAVIYALVCPYEEIRTGFRHFFGENYLEVYIKASAETCAVRDVKGLYKMCSEGKIEHLNGKNEIFEIPENSDYVIDTESLTIDEAGEQLLKFLQNRELI